MVHTSNVDTCSILGLEIHVEVMTSVATAFNINNYVLTGRLIELISGVVVKFVKCGDEHIEGKFQNTSAGGIE